MTIALSHRRGKFEIFPIQLERIGRPDLYRIPASSCFVWFLCYFVHASFNHLTQYLPFTFYNDYDEFMMSLNLNWKFSHRILMKALHSWRLWAFPCVFVSLPQASLCVVKLKRLRGTKDKENCRTIEKMENAFSWDNNNFFQFHVVILHSWIIELKYLLSLVVLYCWHRALSCIHAVRMNWIWMLQKLLNSSAGFVGPARTQFSLDQSFCVDFSVQLDSELPAIFAFDFKTQTQLRKINSRNCRSSFFPPHPVWREFEF